MRTYSDIKAVFAFILILMGIFLHSCATPEIKIISPDFKTLADGVYKGSYDGGLSKAGVLLQMKSGRLLTFDVTHFASGRGKPALAIAGRVLEVQSLDVDTVSGATFSSKVILKAAENAFAAGVEGME